MPHRTARSDKLKITLRNTPADIQARIERGEEVLYEQYRDYLADHSAGNLSTSSPCRMWWIRDPSVACGGLHLAASGHVLREAAACGGHTQSRFLTQSMACGDNPHWSSLWRSIPHGRDTSLKRGKKVRKKNKWQGEAALDWPGPPFSLLLHYSRTRGDTGVRNWGVRLSLGGRELRGSISRVDIVSHNPNLFLINNKLRW